MSELTPDPTVEEVATGPAADAASVPVGGDQIVGMVDDEDILKVVVAEGEE